MAPTIRLLRTDSDNADFQALVALLDHYLRVIDGDEHAFYAQFNILETGKKQPEAIRLYEKSGYARIPN